MTSKRTFWKGRKDSMSLSDKEMNSMPHIAIVGAGIAGLNAALTLQDAGLSCTLYEASSRVGGRMHSDATTWDGKIVTELCGEFIDSNHDTLHNLIRRFGLNTVHLGQFGIHRNQSITYLNNKYRSSEEMAREFQPIVPILLQQADDAGFPTTHTSYTKEGYRLDHMSCVEWIERYVPGGHDSLVGHMLSTACTGFYGMGAQAQSALNLIYMYAPRISNNRLTTTGAMRGSVKIAGGNQHLPLAIAHSLPQESLKLQHQLVSITRNSNNTITLSFTTAHGPTTVTCDHAILALPFSTLRHVDYSRAGFDALKQTSIAQLGYGTISKLFLQFDKRYWYENGPWPRADSGFIITDLDIQVVWDTTAEEAHTGGVLVDYSGGAFGAAYSPPAPYTTTNDSELIQHYAHHCLAQLEHVFPGISAHYTGTAALSYPTGDPYLLGSYSCWAVGQYTQFAGYERVRQGPIHFAGEHCSIEAQGYMEGAAREGARAAREILQG
jgi:monoamine oxidase